MTTIAANDRKSAQFVAAADQTDFACDFAALKDEGVYVGIYAERVRGEDKTILSVGVDFEILLATLDPPEFTARLFVPALEADLYTFFGRTPLGRNREQRQEAGFSSLVAENDAWQTFAALQELRRDTDTLLDEADLVFGPGGAGGVTSWAELQARPPNLLALAGLGGAANQLAYFTGAGAMGLTALTATGRLLIAAASTAAAIALTSPLTTKGDLHVFGNADARLALGANGNILVVDDTTPLGVKWAAPGAGGGAPAWADLTGVPAKVTNFAAVAGAANKVAYFTGADTQAVTTLTAFGRSLIGSADAAAANALLGGGGGGSGAFPTLASYGSVEDDATDDKAAFDAYIADASHGRAWIEKASFYNGNLFDITKPVIGPGRIRTTAGDKAPGNFLWMRTRPAAGTGSDLNYYFSGDISKVNVEWTVLGTVGTPLRKGITEPYFESVTTPHFEVFSNFSGWSGMTSHLNGAIAAGAVLANLDSTAGISTGQTIGFCDANANVVETRVVTVAGAQISWAVGLTNAYPDKRIVTHGVRTHNPLRFMQVNHSGAGDAYLIVGRANVAYTMLAGQVHFFEGSTVGLYGGDIAIGANGNYATCEEYQVLDNGFDGAAISRVMTFTRTNDAGARSVIWFGDFLKSEGSKPIDVFYNLAGPGRVGIDMGRADFSSNSNAAIQLALGHRIYFNATAVAGGRGYGQLAYGYGPSYANTPGDMVVRSSTDGTSDYLEMAFLGAAGVRDARIRIRPQSVNTNANFLSGGTVEAAGALVSNVAAFQPLLVLGAGSGSYVYKDTGGLLWHVNPLSGAHRIALVGIDV